MAVEAERLLAVFEARFASLEKALDKARRSSNKAFGAIERDGTRAENALANVGRRGTPQIDNATKALSRTRFETGNLAAQFQDIGVQLAGGQSPFLIAIQQGTQLNQVLGQAGARGAVSMLGGALASLVNPISIATIATIGLGGAAVQYFASIMENSKPTEETLKQQAALIQRVADRWGDAVPALKEFADELKRLDEQSEALQAGEDTRSRLYQPIADALDDLQIKMVDFLDLLSETPAASVIGDLHEAFNTLREEVQSGTADARDAERVQDLLNETIALGIGDVHGLADAFADLAGQLAVASEKADAVDRSIANVTQRQSQGGRVRYQYQPVALPGTAPTPDRRPNDIQRLDWAAAAAERMGRGGSSRDRAAEQAQRERDAVRQLIDDLRFERSIIGLSAVEREKANALRRAGAAATDEEAREIMRLIDVTHAHQQAVEQQEQAYKTLEQAGKTAMNGLITAMADGKIEAEELLSVLFQVAQQMLSMNGGGGGILNWLFGGGSSLSPAVSSSIASGRIGGLYATGTANTGGMRGEPRGIVHGQEAVIPLPNNGKVPVQINGGGGGSSVLEVRLSSELVGQILQQAEGQAVRISQASLTAYDKSMPGRISYINSHPKRR